MNPVNATALYVSACRALLQCDPAEPETYGGLFNILPFFRDALSCLVCGQLLQDPIAPKNSTCQHHVCKGCKGKKMFLKPSCSWCKDYEDFEENKQLQILIDCYRSLCECVAMWITTEQKAFGVKGYPEVRKMLEEVLVVKEEPEQFEIQLFDDKDNLDVPQIKTEIDSSKYSVDMKLIGSDQASDPEITDPVCVDELLKSTEPCVENVNGDLANTILDQMTSAESCDGHDHACVKSETVSGDFFKDQPCKRMVILCEQTNKSPQPFLSDTSVAPAHTDLPQSQVGASRLSTTHRKARLSRKRSRSESDSEMIQLLPLTSLIQGSSQSSTPTPKTAQEVKSSPPVVVSNIGVLKVNKDSSKNIQIHADLGSRKVPVKSKVSVSKSKAKAKERVLSANLIQGQPPKAVYKKTQEKKGCKCGRATQNPSVLTCRGQRCPCYSNRKACLDCICRGCQNSYMANGEKKLEAFAVPEKALEQTRLTLGINLTSISVRNAGSSPGVLSLSAGSPMASFLTSGADEDQTFEDALDMHFDC